MLQRYCLDCHDGETREGELDLERFKSLAEVRHDPGVWQKVTRQLADVEMPPEKKRQPTRQERKALSGWISRYLAAEAQANAGDPGPVVLRRLSNAEYTHTIRDLTGVDTLDPVREFPADNAAGEGFTNAGAAMVMSPALLEKYLDAAKEVATHLVLLPDGIRFSPYVTERDQTDAILGRIRALYRRYTTDGGGMSVNLQGIKFTTNQGGVLPLKPYLELTIRERARLAENAEHAEALAREAGLSAKYLRRLWAVLHNGTESSSLMGRLRARWQAATPEEVAPLVAWIERERQGLWKYNKVGSTGMEGKPKRWLQTVEPVSSLPTNDHISAYLAAVMARERGEPVLGEPKLNAERLNEWIRFVGLGASGKITLPDLFTRTFAKAHGHETVNGWGPSQTPNLLANHGEEIIRFLTLTVPPRSVCIHPSPQEDAVVAWQSPVDARISISGLVEDADEKCGNGVAWRVELRRNEGTLVLAHGQFDNGKASTFAPIENWPVHKGDVVAMIVQARAGNHVCDTTHVNLHIQEQDEESRSWQIAEHLVDGILAGNPKPDHYGNQQVWHLGLQKHVSPSDIAAFEPDFEKWKADLRQASTPQAFERLAEQLVSFHDESAIFRKLFPPTLCYEYIVPVDEVVTLTLFHREDDLLQDLMLSDVEVAELNRLWQELLYVSKEPLKYLVAFEQISEFATQDNPQGVKALKPHRAPTDARAAAFRHRLIETEPAHLQGVREFAARAWRRPLKAGEKESLRMFYHAQRDDAVEHQEAIRLTLARVLTAPAFLYRSEQPGPGKQATDITSYELATRLSFFLWSSTPDAALLQLAETGELADPESLKIQLKRMCADERITRLAELFACQWLGVYGFDRFDEKNETLFPQFPELRGMMYAETVTFFTGLFREDRSVLEILDADETVIHPQLASFYGMPFEGQEPRRITGLHEAGRGGVLGMASVLAKQSGASRSSPILRGNWVYETLLGEHLPKPPKDVPSLPERVPDGLTARQLIERHSSDPACAKCHAKIDPYGFALEGFDAIGRARENTGDIQALLPDGRRISGVSGLREYLLGPRRADFLRQFCRKFLGFALGRSVQLSDQPLIDEMWASLQRNEYRVSAALELIVTSPQFRQARGRDFKAVQEESKSVQ